MLVLDIRGFMPLSTLENLSDDYIQVMAAIGTCDHAPGLYTIGGAFDHVVGFVVHRERE